MRLEVKCLTIEFFLKSHLVISTGTEEKIRRFCETIFAYESEKSTLGKNGRKEYQKAITFIKNSILKALSIIKKEATTSIQQKLHSSEAEIEAAPDGEKILELVQNISVVTR